jgi:hypothetical protein
LTANTRRIDAIEGVGRGEDRRWRLSGEASTGEAIEALL